MIDRTPDPLDPDEVAAFLDGRLQREELDRVQTRLADDAEARQELIAASRIIAGAPKQKQKIPGGFPFVGSLAAAAAIAIFAVTPKQEVMTTFPVATERTVNEGVDRIDLSYPGDRQTIAGTDTPMSWHPLPGVSYSLIISDAEGHTVMQKSTTDTTVLMPRDLKRGATYYWIVDAFAPDGSSVTSGLREFELSDQ